ncbi:MAG TPA: hypothetical protein PK507_00840 [bacterium]|nr:hypothetical protein [bacterium]
MPTAYPDLLILDTFSSIVLGTSLFAIVLLTSAPPRLPANDYAGL